MGDCLCCFTRASEGEDRVLGEEMTCLPPTGPVALALGLWSISCWLSWISWWLDGKTFWIDAACWLVCSLLDKIIGYWEPALPPAPWRFAIMISFEGAALLFTVTLLLWLLCWAVRETGAPDVGLVIFWGNWWAIFFLSYIWAVLFTFSQIRRLYLLFYNSKHQIENY